MGLRLSEIQWMYGPREFIPVRELVEFILRNGYEPVELSIVNGNTTLEEIPVNDVAYALSVLSSLLISNANLYTTQSGPFYDTDLYKNIAASYDAGFHTLPLSVNRSSISTGVFVPLRVSEQDSYADYKVVDAFYLESKVGNERVRILFMERPLSEIILSQWSEFKDMFPELTQKLLEQFQIENEMDYLSAPQIQNLWLELSYLPTIEESSFFIINYNRRRPIMDR